MSEAERLRDGEEAEARRGRGVGGEVAGERERLRDVDGDGGLDDGVETGEDAERRVRRDGGGEATDGHGRLAAITERVELRGRFDGGSGAGGAGRLLRVFVVADHRRHIGSHRDLRQRAPNDDRVLTGSESSPCVRIRSRNSDGKNPRTN